MRRRAFGCDRASGRAPTGEKRPSRSFSSPTGLFLRRQEGLGSLEKLHVGKLGGQLHAFKAAFSSATALEGQQILVAEVHGQFVQVRFESHRFINAQIIGFGSARLAEPAQIILSAESAKTAAAQVPGIGVVDGPNRSEERRVGKECRCRWARYQ